jgi:Protein of unknown function (DUF3275)
MRSARTHAPAPAQPPEAIIDLHGRLKIKWVKGRNGEFAVGALTTQLGDFSVKDQLLEEYDEGEYVGRFGISRIYSKSFEYYGRITIETRATLAYVEIDDVSNVGKPPEPPSEPDPLDEAPPAPPIEAKRATPTPKATAPAGPIGDAEADVGKDVALDELFGAELGEQLRQGSEVKLDPTVDRILFRRQRDQLKVLGYSFDPQHQQWVRN